MTSLIQALSGYSTTCVGVDDSVIPRHARLSAKFAPFILNNSSILGAEAQKLHATVKKAFANEIQRFFWGMYTVEQKPSYSPREAKDHIRVYDKLEGWLIKGPRADLQVGKDTHIYRVKKALAIKQVIDRLNLHSDAVVPKKYLYYTNNTWYVVAEKLDLLDSPESQSGKIDYRLTAQKAATVATIALECCLLDLHGGNIVLDTNHKVAFIDTEPFERQTIKTFKNSYFSKLGLLSTSDVKFCLGLVGTAMLRRCVTTPEAVAAIVKVERQYLYGFTCKTAAKIAACFLAFMAVSSVPIPGIPTLVRAWLICKVGSLCTSLFTAWHKVKTG